MDMARILVIDNYDSFVYNLVQYLAQLGADVVVRRNDEVTVEDLDGFDGVLISPGPGIPESAGVSLAAIGTAADAGLPLLGVCLGHQAIGQAFGGDVVRAPVQVHGKLSEIQHTGNGVFRGINGRFKATRYHSLVVERATLPEELAVTAETDDRLIMGLAHRTLAVHGVQFHPESIASEHGNLILRNFLDIATAWNASTGRRAADLRATRRLP
jgi:anthranilate synthase component 2